MMIKLQDVYKIYGNGENEVRALNGINLEIDKGEFVAIVGQSGSGKSTCMNMIGCLDVPSKGHYFLQGTDVSTMSEDQLASIRNKTLGFIFQQYNLISKLNVFENVELPLLYGGYTAAERYRMVQEALTKVGIWHRKDAMPNQLSGGQQQRVSIARALAARPPVILADEPTGALDSKTGLEVMAFLKELHAEGKTIVLITHDNAIAHNAKRIVKIADGNIVEDLPNINNQPFVASEAKGGVA